MGEIYALLSAVSFGIAGAAVAKGASKAKGDNGVFLSIMLTLALSSVIWLACGIDLTTVDALISDRHRVLHLRGCISDSFWAVDEFPVYCAIRCYSLQPVQAADPGVFHSTCFCPASRALLGNGSCGYDRDPVQHRRCNVGTGATNLR